MSSSDVPVEWMDLGTTDAGGRITYTTQTVCSCGATAGNQPGELQRQWAEQHSRQHPGHVVTVTRELISVTITTFEEVPDV